MMTARDRALSALPALQLLVLLVASPALAADGKPGSFAEFDARAKAGEKLNVVFFGASLTWGANASDPVETSYRAVTRDHFEREYPAAHFRFRDAAIGGTGSTLGAFRLDRDALAHKPDLVFVDFTANDGITSTDPETLASYESILRRLATAGIPVVQVAFPFKWDIDTKKLPDMARLAAHRALAEAYGNGWGDAVTRICQAVDEKKYTREDLWVTDGVHPHDPGYREFAAAAWDGYQAAVKAKLAPRVPPQPLHGGTYMSLTRFRLADLPALPAGWSKGRPHLTAANHDWLMSRWLDDLVVARNRKLDAQGKPGKEPQPVEPLRLEVEATSILLFGESTAESGKFRMKVDGKPVTMAWGPDKGSEVFDGNRWKTANGFLLFEVARGLDPSVPHLLEIEPEFEDGKAQDLKLESIVSRAARPASRRRKPTEKVPATKSGQAAYASCPDLVAGTFFDAGVTFLHERHVGHRSTTIDPRRPAGRLRGRRAAAAASADALRLHPYLQARAGRRPLPRLRHHRRLSTVVRTKPS